MYCVKCGVKLQDGVKSCPLCSTPVWNPDEIEAPASAGGHYSSLYPPKTRSERIPVAIFISIVFAAASLVSMTFCLKTYGEANWSGYVMLGLAMLYVIAVLPLWFAKPNPVIFVPMSLLAICAYLLYICLYTGGEWFLSFAFPVVMILTLISTAAVALFRYTRRGGLFITGGLLIAIGGSTMLIEMFQHITFGSKMFSWSLYSVSVFTVFGLFLILAGIFRPLREWLKRRSFM